MWMCRCAVHPTPPSPCNSGSTLYRHLECKYAAKNCLWPAYFALAISFKDRQGNSVIIWQSTKQVFIRSRNIFILRYGRFDSPHKNLISGKIKTNPNSYHEESNCDDHFILFFNLDLHVLINPCEDCTLPLLPSQVSKSGPVPLTFLPLNHQHNLRPTGFPLIQPDPQGAGRRAQCDNNALGWLCRELA